MKPKWNITLAGLSFLPALALAQGHVGGGNLCQSEIDRHRETLYQWILSGDAASLDFSGSKTEVKDFAEYRKRMLDTLAPGKVVVNCYLDPARIQDPAAQAIAAKQDVTYRAITVVNPTTGTAEPKDCINYEDAQGISHIDCNYDSIVNLKALSDPNYQLTHHEYASIAGVELRKTDSQPDMTFSSQLSQYEQWVKVKKLGKKVFTATAPTNVDVSIDAILGRYWTFNQVNPTTLTMDIKLRSKAEKPWPFNQMDQASLLSDMDRAISIEIEQQAKTIREALRRAATSSGVHTDEIEISYGTRTDQECKELEDRIACWGTTNVSFKLKSTDPTVVFYSQNATVYSMSSRGAQKKCERWIKEQELSSGIIFSHKTDWGITQEKILATRFCQAVAIGVKNR